MYSTGLDYIQSNAMGIDCSIERSRWELNLRVRVVNGQ